MGGDNEKPLRSTPVQAGKSPGKNLTGDARVHEDGGKAHLHQGGPGDKTKLKVEVPSFVYHQRMLDWVQAGMQAPLVFIDTAAGTRCTITLAGPALAGNTTLDVDMAWEKVEITGNLKALIEHAEGR